MSLSYGGLKFEYSSKMHYFVLLYTDCQGGKTAAIMHHMSFAQITCFFVVFDFTVVLGKYCHRCGGCDNSYQLIFTHC